MTRGNGGTKFSGGKLFEAQYTREGEWQKEVPSLLVLLPLPTVIDIYKIPVKRYDEQATKGRDKPITSSKRVSNP